MFSRTRCSFFDHARRLVRYHSFDFDGCIGTPYLHPKEIPAMHSDLFEFIKGMGIKSPALECMMIFSNRQSIRKDCKNALYNDNNLALQVMPPLAKTQQAYFDPLLLADITLNEKPGTSYCQLMSVSQKMGLKLSEKLSETELSQIVKEVPVDYVYSTDKVNILYAQTHRASCLSPRARIEFNIYDDLVPEVLTPCYEFYRNNPDLISDQVRVRFIHYNTVTEGLPKPELIYTLDGKGKTDPHYYQTVKTMEHLAREHEGEQAEYTFSRYLSSDLMRHSGLRGTRRQP